MVVLLGLKTSHFVSFIPFGGKIPIEDRGESIFSS